MNVAEYYSNSDIRIKKIPEPLIKEKEILVKMQACGICGTDVMEWYRQSSTPKILGHEMSGTVVKSHGGADKIGFAHAIRVAQTAVGTNLVAQIRDDLGQLNKR